MKKRSLRLVTLAVIFICLFTVPFLEVGYGQSQDNWEIARIKANQFLPRLSPEERVGQLFLLTFDGSDFGEDSPIYDLIANYHISGVVLKRANDNFAENNLVDHSYGLIKGLQEVEWQSKNETFESNGESSFNDYIPLFIGISQSGDSYPTDQIITELTSLPSQMAIGATWDEGLAREVGVVLGEELSALGVNLILGPSLDVIESPYGEGRGDLGVRTFGGDPYWAGEMGKAYIDGLHTGSQGKMAVIAKNFPGRGSSDRLPDEEVATVRKSIEQLKLIELAPFFSVTDVNTLSGNEMVDGLLLSHIRYQGFQGNIRATTRPVSFDQTAVDLLMGLSPLAAWRARSGILVSDDLGSQAVRRFFSPAGQVFDGRQIARSAFLSGNDLLYMDRLVSSNDVDRFQTYKTIIDHFVQKYREDKSFADKVDQSVLRILTLKFKIYPEFELEQVVPNQELLGSVGNSSEIVFRVISAAASLVNPRIDQISDALPDAPGRGDRMIFFTDNLAASQCSTCGSQDIVSVDGLQRAILRLYGPGGSGQVTLQNLFSYSFVELQDYVNNPFNRPELEANLSRADWVVFLVHDQNPERSGSYALHNLLSRRPEVLRNKTVLLFSLNAPYYYDATEISAFSAYYALYSKVPATYDVIARIIFQEMVPGGSSPVSIPAVAYNLISVTSPDPNQVIELLLDEIAPDEMSAEEIAGGEDGEGISNYFLGDNIPVRTGIILDHNNNPVPDGTVVRFSLNLQGESFTIQQVETTTVKGVARATFKLQSTGLHEIRAISEPALNSQILILDISEDQGAIISAITPTPIPTLAEEQSSEEALPAPQQFTEESQKNIRFGEWLGVSAAAWLTGAIFFLLPDYFEMGKDRIRMSVAMVLGGLLAGYWFVFNFPGSFYRGGIFGFLSLIIISLVGSAAGGGIIWFAGKRH